MTTVDDRVLARDLAKAAGERLLELRAEGAPSGQQSPDALRKAGDRLSHEFLAAELALRRPGDHVLSEEAADDPVRLSADRVWIVDPLDGTREFGEAGRTDWAVHVALWERGAGGQGALTAGAVALPAQGETLSTVDPPPLPPAADDPLRVVVSRSRPPAFATAATARIGAHTVPLGSAGAKIAVVITGEADAYIHGGGFYEWDTAAPVAVARAVGLHVSRVDGSELLYNQADLLVPDILVCHPAHAERLLQAIEAALIEEGLHAS